MASGVKSMFQVVKRTFSQFSDDECPQMAAALAYYAVFSLPPLLVFIIMLVGILWDPQVVRGEVQEQVKNLLGPKGAEQVRTMIDHAGNFQNGTLAILGGVAALLFGATGLFVQLQVALNKAWEVEPDPEQGGLKNFLFKRLLSLGMVLTIAFLLIISLVLSSVVTATTDTIAGWLPGDISQTLVVAANFGVTFLIITLLFAAMFKFMPDAEVSWRDVWFGAASTSVLFAAGKLGLGLYLGSRDLGSTYGAAGSLVFILIWIYYSSMIFLLGAEFTQVWASRYGDEIVPKEGAVRVVEHKRHIRGESQAA